MSEKEKVQARTLIKSINALPPEMRQLAKAYAEGMAAAAALQRQAEMMEAEHDTQ